jgi:UDP-N-acetylmuramoyl-tripeptide--D-alanyl-D-alanine ligase
MSLWNAAQAVAATGGVAQGDWQAGGVSIDTRSLQPGDLFVALQAARDGHDFVAQALENGAAAALVSRQPNDVAADAPLLIVEDVHHALVALGRAARARCGARVVAVTGSVGKTSTKEMLRSVFTAQGRTHASVASYNNHWGVPLSLARMPSDTDFAVFEIGMSQPGEIAPLARLVRPHIAIITTVAEAHLEAFDDLAGIAREKSSVFEGLEPTGCAIFHGDLATSPLLRAAAEIHAQRVTSFGTSPSVSYRLKTIEVKDAVTCAVTTHASQECQFKLATVGRHFAENALAVLATCDWLGLSHDATVDGLANWTAVLGRGRLETLSLDKTNPDKTVVLIDEAYNANPTSLWAALEVLVAIEPSGQGQRIAYLGDMKELGPKSAGMHAQIADHPAVAGIARIHAVGALMQNLYQALPTEKQGRWTATSGEMVEGIMVDLQAGDVVLVKGSLSVCMGRVVDAIVDLRHARTIDTVGE